MAEPTFVPGGEPALAPAAAVLDPRALTPAQQATPGLPAPQTAAVLGPIPDGSLFDQTWFLTPGKLPGFQADYNIFKSLFEEHNKRLPSLRAFRSAILAAAKLEKEAKAQGATPATNLLAAMVDCHKSAIQTGSKPPDLTRNYTAAGTIEDMFDRISSDAARGGPNAYDPWDGWWAGYFNSVYVDENDVTFSDLYRELHNWEHEIVLNPLGYDQHVQAVTQVDYNPAATPLVMHRFHDWFVSADELLARPDKCLFPNYAINVWSQLDGLTGYVLKKLAAKPAKCMLHIAFLIEPDVLIWVAMEEERPGDVIETKCDLFVFAEAGYSRSDFSGCYDIRGSFGIKAVRWTAKGVLAFTGKLEGIAQQQGDYRQVPKFRDRASLELANSIGLAGSAHPAAISAALEMTRPL